MENPEEWNYFENNEKLKNKRTKICITCNHFRYIADSHCHTLLTCALHRRLMQQGSHLNKGCNSWIKTKIIYAPEG